VGFNNFDSNPVTFYFYNNKYPAGGLFLIDILPQP